MEEEKLEHRNASAAVIGAGDFIGSAIARKFAGEGFSVFAGRRNGDKLSPLVTDIEARGGRIVSIASDAARVGTPREAVYAGAKAAIMGFSKSLAAEVARHGITVNVVSPATVDTPLLRGMLTPEQIERREKANPMGRLGRPEDVAAAVLFFASPRAGYITGQVLSVNGGVVRAG